MRQLRQLRHQLERVRHCLAFLLASLVFACSVVVIEIGSFSFRSECSPRGPIFWRDPEAVVLRASCLRRYDLDQNHSSYSSITTKLSASGLKLAQAAPHLTRTNMKKKWGSSEPHAEDEVQDRLQTPGGLAVFAAAAKTAHAAWESVGGRKDLACQELESNHFADLLLSFAGGFISVLLRIAFCWFARPFGQAS